MTHTRMCQECPVSLEKLSFFFIQVKIIQVLVFDNWHPLKLTEQGNKMTFATTCLQNGIIHVIYRDFLDTCINKTIFFT